MPSAAFGAFNGITTAATLLAVAASNGGPPATLLTGPNPGPAYGGWAGPAGLAANLAWIRGRWNTDRSEDNRRVYIDAVFHQIIGGGGIPPALIVTCQENIAAIGGAGQLGHGYPDYLISALFGGGIIPQWNPSLIVEAKLNMNAAGTFDSGQNQLIAQLTTAAQIAAGAGLGGLVNYQRGMLTDGRYWRFYELFIPANIFRRSRHYDILIAADQLRIFRLVRRFMLHYNNNAAWLV